MQADRGRRGGRRWRTDRASQQGSLNAEEPPTPPRCPLQTGPCVCGCARGREVRCVTQRGARQGKPSPRPTWDKQVLPSPSNRTGNNCPSTST